MKQLFSILVLFCVACKHQIIQPVMPQTAKTDTVAVKPPIIDTLQTITFDYTVDTLNCDTAHFKDFFWGVPTLDVPPMPVGPFFDVFLSQENEDEIFIFREVNNTKYLNAYDFVKNKERVVEGFTNISTIKSIYKKTLLIGYGGGIFKVQGNGDSLTPFLHSVGYRTSWNYNGTQVAHRKYAEDHTIYIFDANGLPLDTIKGEPGYEFDWSKKDVFARQRDNGSIVELNTATRTHKLLVPNIGRSLGFCWLGDYKTMAVVTWDGLYIVNTETGQRRRIKCAGSYNTWYNKISYSKKHRKLFMIQNKLRSPYIMDNNIVSMNIDGSDEKIVVR